MVNRSRAKGTAAESAVVAGLEGWWPYVERRALNGAKDRGDIAGVPGVVIEVKAGALENLSSWMKELDIEIENDAASLGALFVKPRGKTQFEDYYVVMRPEEWCNLMKAAGW